MANVLIVDDSPTEIHVLSKLLEKDGHTVLTASSGEEGVEQALGSLPDLIVMDVVMPGMNGFKATRQIHRNSRTKHIPILMVTTKSQETDIEWGLSQGASDYMVKPVDAKQFRSKVEELLSSVV